MYSVYVSEKIIKIEDSLEAVFDEMPCTIYSP